MSASSKKKLRKEQSVAALTKRQQEELKEAKSLKRYTLTFIISMILVVAIVVGVAVAPTIGGMLDRNTHAVTIGNHELSIADLTYFYIDEINGYYNETYNKYAETYGNMWQMFLIFNLDEPLNKQYTDTENTVTWADYFMNKAIETAKSVYSLVDKADEAKYTMSDENKASITNYMNSMDSYSTQLGYSSLKDYLRSSYGNGATRQGYENYYAAKVYATSFFNDYCDSLEFTQEDIDKFTEGKFLNYTSFDFAIYTIRVSDYLTGDKDSSGNYTAEQEAAALELAKKDAEALINSGATTTEKLDEAIKALTINANKSNAASTKQENVFYESVGIEDVKKWLSDDARKEGDLACIESKETITNEDKTTTEKVNALNVLLFQSRDDNMTKLVDVRHILIQYTNAYQDSNGNVEYPEKIKTEAKEKAEKLLADWKAGENANAESFAALAKDNSDDTSKSDGGLIKDIYPGRTVDAFDKWCFDPARQPGDSAVIETEFGQHVMYFEKTQDRTYRDYLIENDMIEKTSTEWHEGLTKAMNVVKVDLSRMEWDFTFEY